MVPVARRGRRTPAQLRDNASHGQALPSPTLHVIIQFLSLGIRRKQPAIDASDELGDGEGRHGEAEQCESFFQRPRLPSSHSTAPAPITPKKANKTARSKKTESILTPPELAEYSHQGGRKLKNGAKSP